MARCANQGLHDIARRCDRRLQARLRNEWRLIHYGEPPSFVAQGWSEMHLGEGNGGGSIVLTETEAKGGPSRHTSST